MSERLGANFSIDITQLQAGLKTANRLIRESESEFKAAAAGMGDWTKRQEGLQARLQSLNNQITIQDEKVRKLKEAYQRELAAGMDEASDRAIQLRTQINQEEAALARMKKQSNDTAIALSNFGDEAEEAGKDAKQSGDNVEEASGKFEKFGEIAKTAGKMAGAALAAIGTGVIALTKQAVDSYANFEQLKGGVETLFGAGGQSIEEYATSVGKSVNDVKGEYDKLMTAQNNMLNNAANAYKTAGMSANDYIENVTGFSAALISSLDGDTVKAAAAADRAMQDISDNANKMGTDMQSIVGTYQSLARGNFQMLDNLKLGYGGTKTEMERLIADAAKMTDIQKELNIEVKDGDMSFANMVNAISVVQKQMGIMGTTEKEAASTIQGSLAMTKAAWQNLLTGVADDTQDFDLLIDNFVKSVTAAAENLLPRVATALGGIVKLVEKLMPQIPPLIEQFLPVAVDGIMKVTEGIVEILPSIVDTILQVVPQLLTALIGMLPTIVTTVIQLVVQIINALTGMLPTIVQAIIEVVPLIITALLDALPELLQAAITLLMAIVDALPYIIEQLTIMLPQIISTIVSFLLANIPLIIRGAVQLFMGIIKAIPQIITALSMEIPSIIAGIVSGLIDGIPQMIQAGKDLLSGLFKGLLDPKKIWESVKSLFNNIMDNLKSLFGIHSPSTVMENIIGKNLALGIGEGFDKNIAGVNKEISDALNFESPTVNVNRNSTSGEAAGIGGRTINVYQTNNYSQAHSRYEIYKSKQETAAAVRLAMATV